MSQDMIEKAARELYYADPNSGFNCDDAPWEDCGPDNYYHDLVLRRLAAMREPTTTRVRQIDIKARRRITAKKAI